MTHVRSAPRPAQRSSHRLLEDAAGSMSLPLTGSQASKASRSERAAAFLAPDLVKAARDRSGRSSGRPFVRTVSSRHAQQSSLIGHEPKGSPRAQLVCKASQSGRRSSKVHYGIFEIATRNAHTGSRSANPTRLGSDSGQLFSLERPAVPTLRSKAPGANLGFAQTCLR
jgi:hypothetical protein